MQFGTFLRDEAQGAILVHSLRAGGRLFKKGRVLARADLEELAAAGIESVMAVRLEPADVPEDVAATRIAEALAGEGTRVSAAFTGRTNLYAEAAGLALIDPKGVDAVNLIDEAVTLASLAPYAVVAPGDMIATIKIIPYAAPERAVAAAVQAASASPIRVAAFKPMRVALISTQLAGQKPALLDKNRSALEARLKPLNGSLVFESRVTHDAAAVGDALRAAAREGAELFFVFGASAITDRRDVIPAGIVAAGGRVLHFGMPVDPGNLLLLGDFAGRPVVGLPSCARSPKINGFDFVLQRLFAGIEVTGQDIMRMGVGGLLQEIPNRPQPRDVEAMPLRAPRIAALVLAAGLSSRMGSNKLLQEWRGKPLLRWVVEAALASDAGPVIVVTGNEAPKIQTALQGLGVVFAHNRDFGDGLSTSLKTGLAAVPPSADGIVVLLGDMPQVSANLINRMVSAFSPADNRAICIATHEHRRGNPVVWARAFFPEIAALTGDEGAKRIVASHEDLVCEVEANSGVLRDIDTPEALAALRAADSRAPMSDPLYAKDLLRLAANATGAGRLTPCDAEGRAHNPTCGDRVGVTLRLDKTGRIADIAHETQACVLAQASASILGAHIAGADAAAVQDLRAQVAAMLREGPVPPLPFADYSALTGAAAFRNRHTCVLLPIDAVLDALAKRRSS